MGFHDSAKSSSWAHFTERLRAAVEHTSPFFQSILFSYPPKNTSLKSIESKATIINCLLLAISMNLSQTGLFYYYFYYLKHLIQPFVNMILFQCLQQTLDVDMRLLASNL